jgi:succinoglycan biosynthesis protein ExoM
LLGQLLESLANQTFSLTEFEVVVVDNDKLATARSTVVEVTRQLPDLSIRYEIEPIQGISYARNRTVALARGKLLAFIDDDEVAGQNWLTDLVHTMEEYQADGVLGPVIPHYPAGSRAWVVKSRFFERPRFETGTFIASNSCRTSNALVTACSVKTRLPVPFDERFAHSGGEDTDLFRWLAQQGYKFVWCDLAQVSEEVPVIRQTLGYMLERGLRVSATYWQNINRQRSKTGAFVEALLGVGIGFAFAIWGICIFPAGLHRTSRSWVKSAKGFGRVFALTDYKIVGYR